MIYSPSRAADQKWLLDLTNQMLDDLNNNCPITATELANTTKWLSERIRTHDYSTDDRVLKMERRFADLSPLTK